MILYSCYCLYFWSYIWACFRVTYAITISTLTYITWATQWGQLDSGKIIYMFIDNFASTGTKEWFRIERIQVVFLRQMWDLNSGPLATSPADWMTADRSTELSRIKLKKLESNSPYHDQRSFSLSGPTAEWPRPWLWRNIHVCWG